MTMPMTTQNSFRAILTVLLIGAGASLPVFALPQPALLKDMARLDKAYIPVLALASQENVGPAQRAMPRLRERWDDFDRRYRDAFLSDPKWAAGFDRVDEAIARAELLIEEGDNLHQAHESLEIVRAVFFQLRRSNGVDYFLDYLTAFHDPMEAIVLAAKGKAPQDLRGADLKHMRARLEEAQSLWGLVESAEFDPALFEFTPEQATWVQQQVASLSTALDELDRALAESGDGQIVEKAVALKPRFAQLYMFFGDFGGVR